MIDKILINPKTGEPYKNVPPKIAAQYLDITPEFVYKGLREQRLPIGTACLFKGGKWSYNIPLERLIDYATKCKTNTIFTCGKRAMTLGQLRCGLIR